MRQAGCEVLSLALMDARNHTLQLFTQFQNALEAVNFVVTQLPILNPPLWELGHVAWFQERWIGRNMQRALGTRCEPLQARLASIEPDADRWWDSDHVPHASRWTLNLPDVASCRAYLLDTLESTLDLLDKARHQGEGDDALYFYRLCLFHEDMHGEAFTYMAQTLGLALDKPLQEAFTAPPLTVREPLLVPAMQWQMGSSTGDGTGFVFDNEKAAQAVSVPEFEIDAQPVTWAQYVEFVGDGGYDRQELWHPEGWQWLQALASGEGRRGPRYVDQIGVASSAVMQTRFGKPMRMLGNQPAMHMTWWEADAWCRWAGRRLPAEVEWGSCRPHSGTPRFPLGRCLGMDGYNVSALSGFFARPLPILFAALVWHAQGVARWVVCNPRAHETSKVPQFLPARARRHLLRVQILRAMK